MNDEMRLARVDLGPGWIDLGYGEPVVIQKILYKHLNIACKTVPLPSGMELLNSQYQPPQGLPALVTFLEDKYKAKVVVTNGAKQGIAAVMYALQRMGHTSITMHKPYWTSTPNLILDQGLAVKFLDSKDNDSEAMLLTCPNNPDGKDFSQAELAQIAADAKADGVKLIHDAAYYTPIYSIEKPVAPVGDVQIYSFAKMYGLSGLRVGYVVCHDESFVPYVTEFVEKSCSGVSTASQAMALAVETHFSRNPSAYKEFTSECRNAIAAARAELSKLDPQVLEVDVPRSNSMFGWAKIGPKFNAAAVKVNMMDGSMFGQPGYVRFNLAVDSDLIKTAIDRLNGGSNERSGETSIPSPG